MAVSPLVTIPGAPDANAYISIADADQYNDDRPAVGTTWQDATTDQKAAAIIWATRLLDRYFEWLGFLVNNVQRLAWPRSGLMDLNYYNALSWTAIPENIQWATAEFARQLLVSDRTGDSDIQTQGLIQLRIGTIRLDFKEDVYAKPVPDVVVNLIPRQWGYLRIDQNDIGERILYRA